MEPQTLGRVLNTSYQTLHAAPRAGHPPAALEETELQQLSPTAGQARGLGSWGGLPYLGTLKDVPEGADAGSVAWWGTIERAIHLQGGL